MTGATWLAERSGSVSLQLGSGDDVGLAEEAGRESPALDLVAKGGGADAELDCGFGQGEHRPLLLQASGFSASLAIQPQGCGAPRRHCPR